MKTGEGERLVDLTRFVSGCEDKCELDKFVERSKKYLLEERPEEVCANSTLFPSAVTSTSVLPTGVSGTTSAQKSNIAVAQACGVVGLFLSIILSFSVMKLF